MRNRVLAAVLVLLSVAIFSTYTDPKLITVSLPCQDHSVQEWSYEEDGEGRLVEMSSSKSGDSADFSFRVEEAGPVVLSFTDNTDSAQNH